MVYLVYPFNGIDIWTLSSGFLSALHCDDDCKRTVLGSRSFTGSEHSLSFGINYPFVSIHFPTFMRSDMKWLNKKMPCNIPSIIGGGAESDSMMTLIQNDH